VYREHNKNLTGNDSQHLIHRLDVSGVLNGFGRLQVQFAAVNKLFFFDERMAKRTFARAFENGVRETFHLYQAIAGRALCERLNI
jgi:hypothetical protein